MTSRYHQTTSPITSTTLEAPTIRTRSSNLDWFRVAKTLRKGYMRCSSRNTFPAMCIEKVVVVKSGEELYSKTYQSLMAPQRVVLKPNLNYERQNTTSSDARKSFDHSDKQGGTYRETCRGEINFRIQGLPHSVVHSPVRESPEQKMHYKKTCNKIARSIRSARSRRKWSTAWETWRTSRLA